MPELEKIDISEQLERCTAGKAILTTGDKILIVRSQQYWTLPGGKRENGESILEAVERELKEELPDTEISTVDVVDFYLKEDDFNLIIYGRIHGDIHIGREIQEYKLITFEELLTYAYYDQLRLQAPYASWIIIVLQEMPDEE